jgi:hypothetical protein
MEVEVNSSNNNVNSICKTSEPFDTPYDEVAVDEENRQKLLQRQTAIHQVNLIDFYWFRLRL